MKLEQSFEVAAPLERVWEALIDVERVAPCLPGASVTGRNGDGSYNGEFKVKIGPTSAAYAGKLNMEQVDADAHSATMQAAGTDKRGQGGAKATIVSTVTPAGDGRTTVNVATDYHITGRLARFGRGGMIEEISNRLLGEFSKNLQTMLAGDGESAAAPVPEPEPAPEPDTEVEAEAESEPDAVLEGATPIAGAATGESTELPPSEPTQSEPAPGPRSAAPESDPISAVSVVGSAALTRVKENPGPLAAMIFGFLVALRVLRRRS
jgi:carbon monoxide dehydrogenase subunit G